MIFWNVSVQNIYWVNNHRGWLKYFWDGCNVSLNKSGYAGVGTEVTSNFGLMCSGFVLSATLRQWWLSDVNHSNLQRIGNHFCKLICVYPVPRSHNKWQNLKRMYNHWNVQAYLWSQNTGERNMWIGLHDLNQYDAWEWVDGTPLTYT